jgi:alpha-ketoglutarate-dependent taurine dioxygenase
MNIFQNYQQWRDQKLENYLIKLEDCIVEIKNPCALNSNEKQKLLEISQKNNFVIFQTKIINEWDENISKLNQQLGLIDYDKHLFSKHKGLSYIENIVKKQQGEFIPYTNKALNWHTDGYYNSKEEYVRAISLFCIRPAKEGGESLFIDYEMVYLLLKEQNPQIIKALEHPKAMIIPSFQNRPTSVGPVFFKDNKVQKLMMRYTQRKKNIEWFDSQEVLEAKNILDKFLDNKTPYHQQHILKAGQGLICNNVLHKRSAFVDDKNASRLLLRGRYYNRIT